MFPLFEPLYTNRIKPNFYASHNKQLVITQHIFSFSMLFSQDLCNKYQNHAKQPELPHSSF